MLEVEDLMVAKPDKKSVMTYIAAIKNACTADEERRKEESANANSMHYNRGEELYAQGMAKYAKAAADDESHLDDIVNVCEISTINARRIPTLLESDLNLTTHFIAGRHPRARGVRR